VSPFAAEISVERRADAAPARGIVSGALVASAEDSDSAELDGPAGAVGTGVAEDAVARRAGTAGSSVGPDIDETSPDSVPHPVAPSTAHANASDARDARRAWGAWRAWGANRVAVVVR
jgi:hypothetical protein